MMQMCRECASPEQWVEHGLTQQYAVCAVLDTSARCVTLIVETHCVAHFVTQLHIHLHRNAVCTYTHNAHTM